MVLGNLQRNDHQNLGDEGYDKALPVFNTGIIDVLNHDSMGAHGAKCDSN